ncbi:MAG: ScpA family protein [Candidatus Bilamarchaeaceae archaeon]
MAHPLANISYFERIVVKPTWKEILLDLIAQNKIDPWNVDIVKLADEFLNRVKELKTLDLGLHANVILAAAILLKYKSDYLKYFSAPPVIAEVQEVQEIIDTSLIETQLSLVGRLPPKRQITMDELIAEMEKVIKYETNEIKRMPKGAITKTIDLVLDLEDIEKLKEEMLSRVKNNIDESGFATFSSILREKTRMEIIQVLISLLHLAQEKRVSIYQEKLFGEILIAIIEEK